ncbi:MAG: alpha/beta hydrolase [bacterium]|nr:alpha/beta hydrolase [bacterium]
MRILKWVGISLAALFTLAAVALGLLSLRPASTPAISGEQAISELTRIELGGSSQTVLMRGQDRRNPVLLYVHGGPGFSHLPIARFYSEELERHFVVVHWDQRGAGASCEGTDWSQLSVERIVSDTIELSEQLAERFGGNGKIVLLGHSWGSVVGALAAQKRPDLYHAYIGLGQLVNGLRNEELSYEWVVAEAQRRGDEEATAELAGIYPPYATNDEFGIQRGWLNSYNGSVYAVERAADALVPILLGSEYTLGTRLSYFACFTKSVDMLWGDVLKIDFLEDLPRLDVPVYFFMGRHDWNTPFPLVEEWTETLEAPYVEIVWFEDSGHVIPLENPEAFQRVLIEKVLPRTR